MSTFAELGLSEPTIETITKMGFENPTPIQTQAIPKLLENENDMVGLAQTGTGKTAAFGLPLIELVDTNFNVVQALVLAPTRELCLQITKELQSFSAHLKKLEILAVYGGADIVRQIKTLRKGVHIVVATPGRLRDLINRKAIKLQEIDFVVLDEADEMLNMGFKEEIDEILEQTSDEKLTWLFSATMPNEVRRIAKNYMNDPIEISVRGKQIANTDISHQFVTIYPSERIEALKRFLDFDPDSFGLVFCRTRAESKNVADVLMASGYNADALHGDLNQSQRDRVMERFRSRQLQVLVATDVAARGIDVSEITHVFHFNIPDDLAFYTHRAGRTGRAGKKGVSLILAHPNDMRLIARLEKVVKIKFEKAIIPSGKDICELQVLNYMDVLKDVNVSEELDAFMPSITEKLEDLDREELIKRVASMAFNRFLDKYRNAADLNVGRRDRRKKERGVRSDGPMKRFFLNIGQMDVENKGQFLGLICKYGGIAGSSVGRIDMSRTYTHFDVEASVAQQLQQGFKGASHSGRDLRLDESEPRKDNRGRGRGRRNGGGSGRFKGKRFSGGGNRRKSSYSKR